MPLDNHDHVVIVTSEQPLPPFSGNRRKIHDVILALQDAFHLHIITYAANPDEFYKQLRAYWPNAALDWHILAPNQFIPAVRAFATGKLRVTAMRRFDLEQQFIQQIQTAYPRTKLIVDDVVGAELLKRYRHGAIISCNDCASELAYHEMRLTKSLAEKVRGYLRYRAILQIEKQYLPSAEKVHVVKQADGEKLQQLNPLTKTAVISLISPGVIPVLPASTLATNAPPKILIWADLVRSSILAGYVELIPALEKARLWEKMPITVLGRIPKADFLNVSGIAGPNMEYFTYVDNLDTFVQQFDIILLPDIAGSGLKFRLMDGLRLGKCLVGFEHPFEGLPVHSAPYYVKGATAQQVIEALETLAGSGQWRDIGQEAQQVFKEHFSFEHFREAWTTLVQNISPLEVA